MNKSICFQCGNWKRKPLEICASCGADPEATADAAAKSIYLSNDRDGIADAPPLSDEELEQFSEQIESGRTITFDESQLKQIRDLVDAFEGPLSFADVAKVALIIALFFIIPAIAIYAFLFQ